LIFQLVAVESGAPPTSDLSAAAWELTMEWRWSHIQPKGLHLRESLGNEDPAGLKIKLKLGDCIGLTKLATRKAVA
jgi:hypothetical protein